MVSSRTNLARPLRRRRPRRLRRSPPSPAYSVSGIPAVANVSDFPDRNPNHRPPRRAIRPNGATSTQGSSSYRHSRIRGPSGRGIRRQAGAKRAGCGHSPPRRIRRQAGAKRAGRGHSPLSCPLRIDRRSASHCGRLPCPTACSQCQNAPAAEPPPSAQCRQASPSCCADAGP